MGYSPYGLLRKQAVVRPLAQWLDPVTRYVSSLWQTLICCNVRVAWLVKSVGPKSQTDADSIPLRRHQLPVQILVQCSYVENAKH